MKVIGRSFAFVALIGLALVTSLVFLGAPAQARTYDSDEIRFLELINTYRSQHALPPLLASDVAAEAGARHALDMGTYGFFSHTTEHSSFFPVGSQLRDRMRLTGYPNAGTLGENIAAGQQTAQEVFEAWRDSASHRANMLNPDYRVVGIARRVVLSNQYRVFWVTDFGSAVDPSAHGMVAAAAGAPFTDVTKTDAELWDAAAYVKRGGYFEGYPSGALGAWEAMTHRHVALVLERAGLGSRPQWLDDHRVATRGEVMQAFPGLTWDSGRTDEQILRSQVVRLLYRAR